MSLNFYDPGGNRSYGALEQVIFHEKVKVVGPLFAGDPNRYQLSLAPQGTTFKAGVAVVRDPIW